MITDKDIRNAADYADTYSKGTAYYRRGCVKKLVYDSSQRVFSALVQGSLPYHTRIWISAQEEIEDYTCDCPAYATYHGACKHIVAVLKRIQSQWAEYFSHPAQLPASTRALFDFFGTFAAEKVSTVSPQEYVRIVPTLCYSFYGKKSCWLEFGIGRERPYVMRNIRQLIECAKSGTPLTYGKNFTFLPHETVFDEVSEKLFALIQDAYLDERMLSPTYYLPSSHSVFQNDRRMLLSNANLLRFLKVMRHQSFAFSIDDHPISKIKIIEARPPFSLRVDKSDSDSGLALTLDGDACCGLDHHSSYIYHSDAIYHVDTAFSHAVFPLLQCFAENGVCEIRIPSAREQEFFGNILPVLKNIATVSLASEISKDYYQAPLEKHLYLDKDDNGICADVVFRYGELEFHPMQKVILPTGQRKTLLRNLQEEQQLLRMLEHLGFQPTSTGYILTNEADVFSFVAEGVSKLCDLAEIYYSDAFRQLHVHSSGILSAGVRLRDDNGLLELRFHGSQMDTHELLALLASYQLKKRYHRLRSGSFVDLGSPEIHAAVNLMDQLDIVNPAQSSIALPPYRAMYLDSLLRENDVLATERSRSFKKMVQDVCEPQDMEFPVPDGLCGTLREYQKIGFKWLKTLSQYGFGGILADDMGLGKTLQVIALILSDMQGMPSLVVAPTSLIYNWQEEVCKFAPQLNVLVISGTQAERQSKLSCMADYDIVVTSYGTLRNDITAYEAQQFRYCFIDEAQQIKNPHTQNAKTVKRLHANSYFALTGTPIENTLTELWSIFDFIMPDYLLSHRRFLQKFETPIAKHQDSAALKELGRHIRPFVLRRLKKDVLQELPDKIECKMTVEMSGEQSRLYNAHLLSAKKEFETEVLSHGFARSQIKILSILTRLRQICCHPALFLEHYKGDSAKLEMLMEVLGDALDGGHKILIFSQFTSMLGLIREKLDKARLRHFYLDGTTAAAARMRLVSSFNAGAAEIFLISLKAGGTGLNLTGADMVIHVDPWWNPAAEDQATDRAYRIGQDKVVEVIRLITKDSIEEKIYQLQQKKRGLIETVIQPGESFLAKMTEQEVRELLSLH